MWTQSSRRLKRRRAAPVIVFVVVGGACVLGALSWSGSWIFRKRPAAPIELNATAAPEKPAEPAAPPPAEKPAEHEIPEAYKPETGPSSVESALVERANAELKSLRSGEAEPLLRRLGAMVLDERYPRDTRADWLPEVRELARRVVFSGSRMQNATAVTVSHGDTLIEICQTLQKTQKVSVTPRFLEMVNDVSAARLRAGVTLKVPTERMSILVDKDEYRLYVLLGGCFLKDYTVGTGRDQRTPEGRFTIITKTKNPQWTDPDTGKLWKYGESGHQIGSRWMGFGGEHGRTGYGIHGTIDPSSIGRAESAGCIRMNKDDVEELYDLVPQGSEVVIRR
jgi:lipoprotein-anchoring transpeptidase ErfK/SrfK